ncbi:MAG: homoserine kinase [Dechloromonas sp.]|nr:homoserine kinase [Dechloromonas sp.]
MSVYTPVDAEALADWLQPLACGVLRQHVGIAAGMQNSNYFVDTSQGRYVLTLFEHLEPPALRFYLDLQAELAGAGLPCPRPLADAAGQRWRLLCGKPAALLSCLPGRSVSEPSVAQCQQLGALLARLHQLAADWPQAPANPCGAGWCMQTAQSLLSRLQPKSAALLVDELAWQATQPRDDLPGGVIHGDLFRDNVLWDECGQLSGVLDFYFAGVDAWLFDLAVVANDWCPTPASLAALLAAYRQQRALTPAEHAAWPAMRRAAALRFWLLRLDVALCPRPGDVVTVKAPAHFEQLLQRFRLAPEPLPR